MKLRWIDTPIIFLNCILVFIVIEGTSGLIIFFQRTHQESQKQSLEWKKKSYDPELGWRFPGFFKNIQFYGPGKGIVTNSEGLREEHEIGKAVPAGKTRILCSGDSFTWGDWVGNHETWCHLLETKSSVLQTVNLGGDGYGLDQMYLEYKKLGAEKEHQISLVAAIWHDFERVGFREFSIKSKPYFRMRDNRLTLENTPVPKPGPLRQAIYILAESFARTRLYQLVHPVLFPKAQREIPEERLEIVSALLTELDRLSSSFNSKLVMIYFPSYREEKDEQITSMNWKGHLEALLSEKNVSFLDLSPDFDSLPYRTYEKMFTKDGHYTEAGHAFVAESIYRYLKSAHLIRG